MNDPTATPTTDVALPIPATISNSRAEPQTISNRPPTAQPANRAVATTEPQTISNRPPKAQPANRAVATTATTAAVWALLLAKLAGGWGLGWDIRWHILIGRDSFWIPPHVLTYTSVTAAVIVAFGVVGLETWRARGGDAPAGTRRVAGLVGTPGFHLVWLGMALTILAAPIDDLWHRLFGLDVTLWSPPHLLGVAGAQVSTLALLIVAVELWPARSARGWPRCSLPERFSSARSRSWRIRPAGSPSSTAVCASSRGRCSWRSSRSSA